MILIVVPVVFIAVLFTSAFKAMQFFDKREGSDTGAFIGSLGFSVFCVILSMYLVIFLPANLAVKYCDYEPVYSHSRPIYNLQEDYIIDFDKSNYMVYTNDSDGNNIRPKYLPKETTEIFDINTNTPYINYYSPKFKNKLINLYFCESFTIDRYDIYI